MDRSVGRAAVVSGVVAVAGSFAAVGSTRAFLPAALESFLVAALPGPVVMTTISTLGNYASTLAFGSALALSVLVCALPVGVALVLARHRTHGLAVVLSLSLVWGLVAAVTGSPLSATGAGLGAALAVVVVTPRSAPDTSGRRRLLRTVGGLAGALGVAALLGSRGEKESTRPADEEVAAEIDERLAEAEERALEFTDLDPLVTPIADFYEVDINTINPTVDTETWRLDVTGAVLEERTLTFDDLSDLPVEHRFMTLRCVGDEVNGEKMSTALWTGIPVDAILEEVRPAGTHVMLHAADDYYNEFPLEALRGGLLAYRMNGEPLPKKHGSPVRALVPGHWGEINVKWLTEIEVLDEEEKGYWEKLGWYGTGLVHTVAKIWTETRLDDGRFRVGGLAYAGTRGVSRVEVSIDGGETWDGARLSEPLPDEDVWRQWVYEFEPTRDSHEVVVRAVELDGTVQTGEEQTPQPRGATGWASTVVEP